MYIAVSWAAMSVVATAVPTVSVSVLPLIVMLAVSEVAQVPAAVIVQTS